MFKYDRLDALVKETGKKKNYLGKKMGFSERYLNDAKKQNTDIKGIPLEILAEELGTTPEYLTGQTDIKEKSPTPDGVGLDEETMELWEAWNSGAEAREFLLHAARMVKERRNK